MAAGSDLCETSHHQHHLRRRNRALFVASWPSTGIPAPCLVVVVVMAYFRRQILGMWVARSENTPYDQWRTPFTPHSLSQKWCKYIVNMLRLWAFHVESHRLLLWRNIRPFARILPDLLQITYTTYSFCQVFSGGNCCLSYVHWQKGLHFQQLLEQIEFRNAVQLPCY